MKHSLADINEYLFDQLERLTDDSLTPEQLDKEIERADSISKLTTVMVQNANVVVKAAQLKAEYSGDINGVLPLLGGGNG